MYYKIYNSIPGRHLLDASNILCPPTPPPSCGNQKCLQALPNVPGTKEDNLPLVKSHSSHSALLAAQRAAPTPASDSHQLKRNHLSSSSLC